MRTDAAHHTQRTRIIVMVRGRTLGRVRLFAPHDAIR
jgi:hypothetical protein